MAADPQFVTFGGHTPDRIRHLVKRVEPLGEWGWRLVLHNDRCVDCWPSTGTCGPMGGPHFKKQPWKLIEIVESLSGMPKFRVGVAQDMSRMSDDKLALMARGAYPIDPRMHPQAVIDRSVVHELIRRIEARPPPAMLLTQELAEGHDDDLMGANPDCKHEVVCAPGGGVKCTKCPGWFCF